MDDLKNLTNKFQIIFSKGLLLNGKLQFDYNRIFGLCAGDIADLHLGEVNDAAGKKTPVTIKIARHETDNDLMQREGIIMQELSKKLKPQYAKCVPQILDSFQIKNTIAPWCNVMEFCPGFFSVEDIRKLSTGVDGRTLVWMWKRLLSLLSWVHHNRIIHGAILPPHVMYWPDGSGSDERVHTMRLVDWCYAIQYDKEKKLKAWVPDYQDFYPPEIQAKKLILKVGPATDLYMAAATMIYVTGGDVKAKKFPSKIPGQIAASIKKCLHQNYGSRPQNIGEYFDSFVATAKDVYGKPKFHEFKLPL